MISLSLSIFLSVSMNNFVPFEDVDRSQIVQLVHAAQQHMGHDVGFEYEGKRTFPGEIEQLSQGLKVDGTSLSYTGTYMRRDDGSTLTDGYYSGSRSPEPYRISIASLKGSKDTLVQRPGETRGTLSVNKSHALDHGGVGDYHTIWLSDWLVGMAKSAYRYQYKGTQKLDGVDCVIVEFQLDVDGSVPADDKITYKVWIDISRDLHIVRREEHWGSESAGLVTVALGRFEVSSGKTCWLPISGRVESYVAFRGGKQALIKEPVYYDTYYMIPATVRFNRDLTDDQFSVKARPGDVVSDGVRKARYEFGQYMVRPAKPTTVPTDVDVKANLDRMLNDSAVMAGELKASSPMRDGPGWASYWPWAVAGAAVAGAGVIFYKRRAS